MHIEQNIANYMDLVGILVFHVCVCKAIFANTPGMLVKRIVRADKTRRVWFVFLLAIHLHINGCITLKNKPDGFSDKFFDQLSFQSFQQWLYSLGIFQTMLIHKILSCNSKWMPFLHVSYFSHWYIKLLTTNIYQASLT